MSDNPLLNRPLNPKLQITINNEDPLSVLWEDFKINIGRFLLTLWRNVRARFSVGDQLTLQEVFARAIQTRTEQRAIYGYSTQEVADGLRLMANAKPGMRDYQPEQCSFTQINDDGFALVYDALEAQKQIEARHRME